MDKLEELAWRFAKIEQLNLNTRIQNILIKNGITLVVLLQEKHWYEIKNLKYIGKKRLRELEKVMMDLGLSLKAIVPEYDEEEINENPFNRKNAHIYDIWYDYESMPDGPIKEERIIFNRNIHYRISKQYFEFMMAEPYYIKTDVQAAKMMKMMKKS